LKKLKKFWHENSVLLVLLMILVACLIAISVVVFTYFVGDSSSKYGDRLDGITEHEFKENEQKELIAKLKEDKLIEEAKLRISGKTIYISIKFITKTTLVEAESKALASLEYFKEDILGFYDLNDETIISKVYTFSDTPFCIDIENADYDVQTLAWAINDRIIWDIEVIGNIYDNSELL